jgi:hypothetical protein
MAVFNFKQNGFALVAHQQIRDADANARQTLYRSASRPQRLDNLFLVCINFCRPPHFLIPNQRLPICMPMPYFGKIKTPKPTLCIF